MARNDFKALERPGLTELLRTNDIVLISLIESLFKEAMIEYLVLDQHMSILEGSIGIIPRRLMVSQDQKHNARRLLADAGLAEHLNVETGQKS